MALKILYGGTDHDLRESHLKEVLDSASQIGLNMVIIATKKSNVAILRAEQIATGTNAMRNAVIYGRSLNPPVEQGICIDFYSYPPVYPPNPNETDGNNNLFDPNYITNRPATLSGVYLNTAEYYQSSYVNDAVWLLQNTNANYFEIEEAVFCCKYNSSGQPIPDPSRINSLTAFLTRIRMALKSESVKPSVIVGCNIPSGQITSMQSEGLDPETIAGKPTAYNNYTATPPILDYITMQSGVANPVSFMNTYNIMKNLVSPLPVNAVIYIVGKDTLDQAGCNKYAWTKACFNQNYIGCLKEVLSSDTPVGIFSTEFLSYNVQLVDYQNAPPEAQSGNIDNATRILINGTNPCPKPQFNFNINQV